MTCVGCEQRRKEVTLLLEATRTWMSVPVGPSVMEIYQRLRTEAIQRGDFNERVEPSED